MNGILLSSIGLKTVMIIMAITVIFILRNIYRILVTMATGQEIRLKPTGNHINVYRGMTTSYVLLFQDPAFTSKDKLNPTTDYLSLNLFQRKNIRKVGGRTYHLKYRWFGKRVCLTDAIFTWKHAIGLVIILCFCAGVLIMAGYYAISL